VISLIVTKYIFLVIKKEKTKSKKDTITRTYCLKKFNVNTFFEEVFICLKEKAIKPTYKTMNGYLKKGIEHL
jgi:hypothetical protein